MERLQVGFTGSRQLELVAPERQEAAAKVITRLCKAGPVTLHHGDCLGADAWAHALVRSLMQEVELHPPDNAHYRAWCGGANEVHRRRPYLDRNHDIVDASILLLALPSSTTEVVRSGSWATVRYARRVGCPVEVF